MLKIFLIALLPFLFPFSDGSDNSLIGQKNKVRVSNTATIEKMIVANGSVAMDVNLNKLNGKTQGASDNDLSSVRFEVANNSFFKIIVSNDELRGAMPGTMSIVPKNSIAFPGSLNESYRDLVIERLPWGQHYELAIRNQKGIVYFYIEGFEIDYNANNKVLGINEGRLLLSREYANEIGRPEDAGSIVGKMSINANLTVTEVTEIVDGENQKTVLPAGTGLDPQAGTIPGPDVVVGDVVGLAQFGSASGTRVGLAVGTDSCNYGTIDLNWFQMPNNDHPVIPQNLYRMSGGPSNNDKFEQIGQSQVKHAFTALTQNLCGLGCNGVGGTRLGSGCSDPYSANLNAGPNLGSKAWINPFTGFYPRGDSTTPSNNHTGHAHNGTSHRILTEISDLSTTSNPGASYFAEAQYVTPHEYAWCQANPTQCNMYNNVSYRQYSVNGTTSPFTFSPVGATVRTKPAILAWTGATFAEIKPAPGVDGVGTIAYKVTNPSPGVWHYEYAIYNQNLDRGISSFTVPTGSGVTLSNIGFYAPPQHPGSTGDGTLGDAGFSSAAWAQNQTGTSMNWSTEAFAVNQNANAIRWATMYNFRFDSNRPPQTTNATIGFFKTGNPITVQIQAPAPVATGPFSISGRVVTSDGIPLRNVTISISDQNGGNIRGTSTNFFGNYQFTNVTGGQSYTLEVQSKRYTFAPRVLSVNDNLIGIDFTAAP